MNNEIKEILDNIEYVADIHKVHIKDDYKVAEEIPSSLAKELRLNSYSAKLLLDYITNLQQNQENISDSLSYDLAVARINELENILNKIMASDGETTTPILDLINENEKLNHIIEKQDRDIAAISKGNKKLKSRIEKAVELLKRYTDNESNYYVPVFELIDILNGRSDE